MHILRKYTVTTVLFGTLFFASCKKEISNNNPSAGPDTTASAADKIKDTALADARDIYLWYQQIPDTFNARNYADPNGVMEAIRKYSIEPGFTGPVDRWSFGMKQTDWDNLSSGVSEDFGLGIFFRTTTDLRVKHVEPASPAGLAGIHRGWRILKINGGSNITTSDADINFISSAVFDSKSTLFTFQKPDGTTTDITLNAATYQENPVILDSVYHINGKAIGYFAFNSFLGDTTQINNSFQSIFADFASKNINDLIVDLRYNGGGYVSLAETLSDYLAPTAANGNVMITTTFNDKYSRLNSTDYVTKLGSLNLSRVFFIVSQSTASASELLINSLKPYMDVQLIGDSTYGKPVGFFNIPVGDWYIFPVSFRTVNKNGEGGYFKGMAPNKAVADGLDKDWGDLQEACLASTINYISNGVYSGQATRPPVFVTTDVASGNKALRQSTFVGAVDTRHRR